LRSVFWEKKVKAFQVERMNKVLKEESGQDVHGIANPECA
jgi:hypothetical protein